MTSRALLQIAPPLFFRWMAALALAATLSSCREEVEFPSQPVLLICPWSAGGGTDRVSRQMAALLEEELGVPVNVINATGGSGVTGHTRGALARPDGYTITMLTVELNMLHWRGLTPVTHESFAPLMLINQDSAALFVRADAPWRTLTELEEAIRAAPGTLKMSGTAQGGIWHVAAAGWLNARGLGARAATWISINGAGPSLQELAAGGVDIVSCSLPEADAMLAGGQVRCLGVMSAERIPGYESVPSFGELGQDWAMAGWRGIGAPRDTPPERLAVLAKALERVTTGEAFAGFMKNAGFNVSIQGPEEFGATLAAQDELFREVLSSEAFASVSEEYFGALIFPGIVAGLLALAVAAMVAGRRKHSAEEAPGEGKDAGRTGPGRDGLVNALVVVVGAALFALVVERAGFVLCGFVFLLVMLLRFGVRPPAAMGVAALAATGIYQVFSVWLRVPLPRGFLDW